MATHEDKLMTLMREHPRLSSRKYAEMAVDAGLEARRRARAREENTNE